PARRVVRDFPTRRETELVGERLRRADEEGVERADVEAVHRPGEADEDLEATIAVEARRVGLGKRGDRVARRPARTARRGRRARPWRPRPPRATRAAQAPPPWPDRARPRPGESSLGPGSRPPPYA